MDQENSKTILIQPGSLTITTERGCIRASNNARNLLSKVPTTIGLLIQNYLVRAPSQPENAGIIAWQDDHNFVKLIPCSDQDTRNKDRNRAH